MNVKKPWLLDVKVGDELIAKKCIVLYKYEPTRGWAKAGHLSVGDHMFVVGLGRCFGAGLTLLTASRWLSDVILGAPKDIHVLTKTGAHGWIDRANALVDNFEVQ